MNITDIIKDSVLEQFSGSVSVSDILLSLLFAFALSIFINFIYKKSFTGVVYNKTMPLTITLLAMTTAMIIRTINSNLALSLGMVGALSIVRFRTAIKEPVDTAFMFWGITVGIMCGAGLYLVSAVGCVALGLFYYLSYLRGAKAKSQYLLVVICNKAAYNEVVALLDTIKNKKLKSKSTSANDSYELTYEIVYNKQVDTLMNDIQAIAGVKNVNLVTYTNEFGL